MLRRTHASPRASLRTIGFWVHSMLTGHQTLGTSKTQQYELELGIFPPPRKSPRKDFKATQMSRRTTTTIRCLWLLFLTSFCPPPFMYLLVCYLSILLVGWAVLIAYVVLAAVAVNVVVGFFGLLVIWSRCGLAIVTFFCGLGGGASIIVWLN